MELELLQKEVAEWLGLDECTIGNWEKDRTYPAVWYVPRLIEYLGYDPFSKPQTLGDRLRAKRRALGLPRKRLAALIGIDDGTIQRYERGVWRPGPRNREILEHFLERSSD